MRQTISLRLLCHLMAAYVMIKNERCVLMLCPSVNRRCSRPLMSSLCLLVLHRMGYVLRQLNTENIKVFTEMVWHWHESLNRVALFHLPVWQLGFRRGILYGDPIGGSSTVQKPYKSLPNHAIVGQIAQRFVC